MLRPRGSERDSSLLADPLQLTANRQLVELFDRQAREQFHAPPKDGSGVPERAPLVLVGSLDVGRVGGKQIGLGDRGAKFEDVVWLSTTGREIV